jgi:dynein heavy chain
MLCMSPTGNTLNERIRNFPAIINCCTIDWFEKWPEEAIMAVAKRTLDETPFSDDLKGRI